MLQINSILLSLPRSTVEGILAGDLGSCKLEMAKKVLA